MDHPEQIAHLAAAATQLEPQPANAAALLVDAAAMCASDCGLNLEELIARLTASHAMMIEAKAAVERLGVATALKQ